MKRLIKAQQNPPMNLDDKSEYDFLSFSSPSTKEEKVKPKILDATEMVAAFKKWFIDNWIQQGKDPQQLKYVGLLPEEVFVAWAYANVDKAHLIFSIIDQAKFLLKSERILR